MANKHFLDENGASVLAKLGLSAHRLFIDLSLKDDAGQVGKLAERTSAAMKGEMPAACYVRKTHLLLSEPWKQFAPCLHQIKAYSYHT